jgi:inner membrane protein involved in colicin E2 resistance
VVVPAATTVTLSFTGAAIPVEERLSRNGFQGNWETARMLFTTIRKNGTGSFWGRR